MPKGVVVADAVVVRLVPPVLREFGNVRDVVAGRVVDKLLKEFVVVD